MNDIAPVRTPSVETELRFMRLPEVLAICSMSKTSVYAAMKRGDFPRPVKLGERSLWVKREIVEWMEQCIADRKKF